MPDEKIDKALYDALAIEKDAAIAALREELDLSRSGLNDAAGIRAARAEYSAVEVDTGAKKPTIKEWWSNLSKDPTQAPRTLRGYLEEGKGAATGASAAKGAGEKGTAGTQAAGQDQASVIQDLSALTAEINRQGRPPSESQLKKLQELRDAAQSRRG